MGTNEAILGFLEDPVNLATAYDVREWLKDAERHIFETFWSYVRGLLDEQLTELNCRRKWHVIVSPSLFEGTDSHVSIAPRTSGKEDLLNSGGNYSIAAEQLGGESGSCYFGIFRGTRRHEPLEASLKAEGFRSSAAWSGYRYFKSLHLPEFRLDRDSILQLNADNQSSERLVARAVAAQMLGLFEKYRVLLEQLNE
jgi:hypothetical protein